MSRIEYPPSINEPTVYIRFGFESLRLDADDTAPDHIHEKLATDGYDDFTRVIPGDTRGEPGGASLEGRCSGSIQLQEFRTRVPREAAEGAYVRA